VPKSTGATVQQDSEEYLTQNFQNEDLIATAGIAIKPLTTTSGVGKSKIEFPPSNSLTVNGPTQPQKVDKKKVKHQAVANSGLIKVVPVHSLQYSED
jgi:hypothetical protein